MSRRKISRYMYASLAGSCARDIEQAVRDAVDTLADVEISATQDAPIVAGVEQLREIKKRLRESAALLRMATREVDVAIAVLSPKKPKKDDRQLPLPHT